MSAAAHTIELIKHYPQLFGLYFFFALMPWLAASETIPPIIDLALAFISLGWFAARFVYLNRAYRHKPLELKWYKLWEQILLYGFKLLPVMLGLLAVLLIPAVGLALWFGRWFSAAYLESGYGLTSQQAFVSFLQAMFNFDLWGEFFTQNLWLIGLYQVFQLCLIVGWLVAKVAVILIILERCRIIESVGRTFIYLNEHLSLLFAFIGLTVASNLILQVSRWLWSNSVGLLNRTVAELLVIATLAFIGYTIDAFILAYYIKADKRSFIQRNLLRWWKSRGRESK